MGSSTQKMEFMEFEVEIWDSNKRLISTYTSIGEGTAYIANYWGYGIAGKYQAANIKATTYSLSGLKKQLQRDSSMINAKLLQNGPIK